NMKKALIKLAAIIMTAAFLAGTVQAQDAKPKDAAPPAPAQRAGMPFHGKLTAVDTNAKTVSLHGKDKDRVFQVTSKTRIMKAGKPATFEDLKVGDEVGGFAREVDGKLELVSLRVGAKPVDPSAKPKKEQKQ